MLLSSLNLSIPNLSMVASDDDNISNEHFGPKKHTIKQV